FVDFPQSPLAVDVIAIFTAVAIARSPRHRLDKFRPLIVKELLEFILQLFKTLGRDIICAHWTKLLAKRAMGNQLVNVVLNRWLEDRPDLVPALDCAACTLALERPSFASRWRSYKCCTFQPFVANFLAGAMLEAGLEALAIHPDKALRQPLGVIPTAGFRELYLTTPEDLRGKEHLCSYFDKTYRRCT